LNSRLHFAVLTPFLLTFGACSKEAPEDTGTETAQDSDSSSVLPAKISLGEEELVTGDLTNVLHIAALADGSIAVAESNAPPATRGRLAVVSPEGEIQTLISDVPVVSFTHDVNYMGPDGMTLLSDGETLLWSLFLGAGDIQPVEDNPDWDPSAGSMLYEVPLYDETGALLAARTVDELTVWTQSRTDFVFDLAWEAPTTLWATEPGKNSLYFYESESDRRPTAWPLSKIAIEPVRGQEEVEAVPTGVTLFQGVPVVGQLGGGIYREDGVTPTGERYGQRVGRVSTLSNEGIVHLASGLPSVLDVVGLEDSMILACFDYYSTDAQMGFLIQLMPDGSTTELLQFSDFPTSLAVSGDDLYVMGASGRLVRYPMTFEEP